MARRNINSIQQPSDMNMDEYILQSIANLGQRIGVQGDGIKLDSFVFGDLINVADYNSADYMGVIKKYNGNTVFSVINKSTMLDVITPVEIENINNYTITSSSVVLEKAINGIDEYSPSGIISLDSNSYTIILKGVSNDEVIEFLCETFDRSSNVMISAVRLRKFGSVNNEHVALVHRENYGTSAYIDTWYECTSGYDVEYFADILINTYGETMSASDIISDPIITANFESISSPSSTIDNYSKYIQFFTYDSTYLYRYMKEYYSEVTFKSDNVQFRKQILVALFNMIIENSTIATEIYVPLDYVFNYACNTNNEWQIYYNTTDVIVKYMADDVDSQMLESSGNASGIICYTDTQERVTLYNYSVNYDNENTSTVCDINVYKHFTLPYVNGEGYWVINDNDTTVYAKGKDAGNPNIIIVESHKNVNNHVVVSGANKDTVLENSLLSWTQKIAYTEPLEKINTEDLSVLTLYDYFKVKCTVPDMSAIPEYYKDEWYNLLENSLIINIADINCIDYSNNINYTKEDVIERYGSDGVITTLWYLDSTTKEFEYIKRQNSTACAADFNYITNAANLIKWHLENYVAKSPDRYKFTYLVFDPAFVALKNNTSDTRSYIYPTLSNKASVLFNTSNYNNEFNFMVKYHDIADDATDNNIVSVGQINGTHYFDTTYTNGTTLAANIVTNSLYTYNIGLNKYKFEEYIPNYNVPTLDLGEVLTRNQTLLNRLNIMSFNKYGATYMSYIGTSYEMDKNVMVIGTSYNNINMGTETLIDYNERSAFNTQTELDINFDNMVMSGYVTANKDIQVKGALIAESNSWKKTTTQVNPATTHTTWTANYAPTGRYIYEVKNNYYNTNNAYAGIINLNSTSSNMFYTTSNAVYKYAVANQKLFTICTIPEIYYGSNYRPVGTRHIYIGDGIYIPALLYQMGLGDYVETSGNTITLSNVILSANNNIYKYNDVPTVLQLSSTLLTDSNYYNYVKNNGIYAETISDYTYEMFTSNTLNISYYVSNGKAHITIKEDCQEPRTVYVRKITKEY